MNLDKYFYLLFASLYSHCPSTHVEVRVQKQKLILSFYHVDPEDRTQVTRQEVTASAP